MKNLKILFIGNSHTYYNDMPQMVRQRASEDGYGCHVTMLAHGGWFLSQHAEEPEPRFNILYGGYDYVVLQEHTHPFAPREQYLSAVKTLVAWIREAGSTPVIYETWAKKTEPDVLDEYVTDAQLEVLERLLKRADVEPAKFNSIYGLTVLSELPAAKYDEAVKKLETAISINEGKGK